MGGESRDLVEQKKISSAVVVEDTIKGGQGAGWGNQAWIRADVSAHPGQETTHPGRETTHPGPETTDSGRETTCGPGASAADEHPQERATPW